MHRSDGPDLRPAIQILHFFRKSLSTVSLALGIGAMSLAPAEASDQWFVLDHGSCTTPQALNLGERLSTPTNAKAILQQTRLLEKMVWLPEYSDQPTAVVFEVKKTLEESDKTGHTVLAFFQRWRPAVQ
jgi:hypothetical protein